MLPAPTVADADGHLTNAPAGGTHSLGLSVEQHRVVCIHEAAHAVVNALHPRISVYSVEVAPVGATDWTVTGRKGRVYDDLWGLCSISDLTAGMMFMRWVEEEGRYAVDRKGYRKYLTHFTRTVAEKGRSHLRAHVRGSMAGPISEAIQAGNIDDDFWLDLGYQEGEDLTVAAGLCELLPFRNEYDRCFKETIAILKQPDTWARVLRLADALAMASRLEGYALDRHLQSGAELRPTRRWV